MNRFKPVLLSVAEGAGIISFCRLLNRQRIRILAYHGVDSVRDPVVNWDDLQVEPGAFRSHLEELRRHYAVVSLRGVIDALAGQDELPNNAVAITFDDGYRNNLTVAAPILKEFRFPAAFFVTTDFLDGGASPWWYRLREALSRTARKTIALPGGGGGDTRTERGRIKAAADWESFLRELPAAEREQRLKGILSDCGSDARSLVYPFMSGAEVRQLADMGFEVGAHTVTHVSMGREEWPLLEKEIEESIAVVNEIGGRRSAFYAYPYGAPPAQDQRILEAMKRCGIRAGVTTSSGMVCYGDDVFRLKRLNVAGHRGPAFSALISGLTGIVRRPIAPHG